MVALQILNYILLFDCKFRKDSGSCAIYLQEFMQSLELGQCILVIHTKNKLKLGDRNSKQIICEETALVFWRHCIIQVLVASSLLLTWVQKKSCYNLPSMTKHWLSCHADNPLRQCTWSLVRRPHTPLHTYALEVQPSGSAQQHPIYGLQAYARSVSRKRIGHYNIVTYMHFYSSMEDKPKPASTTAKLVFCNALALCETTWVVQFLTGGNSHFPSFASLTVLPQIKLA